jgi:predicted nucleic acid-binding protein
MISNATPLIFLAKINQLELLQKLFTKVYIPLEVEQEILVAGKPGYYALKAARDEGWLFVEKTKTMIPLGLGKGETAAISLAKEKADSILLDDAAAIKAAEGLHVATIRTTSVLFLAVQKKILDREKALQLLNALIESGYYIAPRCYTLLLGKLRTS